MKRFLSRILIAALLVILIFSALIAFDTFVVGPQYRYNYQASVNNKLETLRQTESPKIILVGNSNLSFGIDSPLLEKEMGMPVVNLGLHGALGNRFHENMAKINIQPGDIVVVSNTDYSNDTKIEDRSLAWITVDNNWKLLSLFSPKEYAPMLAAYPNYLKTSIYLWLTKSGNENTNDCYSVDAFNSNGDVCFKPSSDQFDPSEYFKDAYIPMTTIDSESIDRINRFNEYVTSRGATLVIAGFPIAYGEYSKYTDEDYTNFGKELSAQVDCDVISDFTDYLFPYEYFYNTYLHLNDEGTKARTLQLAKDLKDWRAAK
jgi:signal peptidase I